MSVGKSNTKGLVNNCRKAPAQKHSALTAILHFLNIMVNGNKCNGNFNIKSIFSVIDPQTGTISMGIHLECIEISCKIQFSIKSFFFLNYKLC